MTISAQNIKSAVVRPSQAVGRWRGQGVPAKLAKCCRKAARVFSPGWNDKRQRTLIFNKFPRPKLASQCGVLRDEHRHPSPLRPGPMLWNRVQRKWKAVSRPDARQNKNIKQNDESRRSASCAGSAVSCASAGFGVRPEASGRNKVAIDQRTPMNNELRPSPSRAGKHMPDKSSRAARDARPRSDQPIQLQLAGPLKAIFGADPSSMPDAMRNLALRIEARLQNRK